MTAACLTLVYLPTEGEEYTLGYAPAFAAVKLAVTTEVNALPDKQGVNYCRQT